jgi:hypothetical protein
LKSVCLRIGSPTGANEQILITVGYLRICSRVVSSQTRGRVCKSHSQMPQQAYSYRGALQSTLLHVSLFPKS